MTLLKELMFYGVMNPDLYPDILYAVSDCFERYKFAI